MLTSAVSAAVAQDNGRAARRQAAEDRAMAKRMAEIQDSLSYVEAMNARVYSNLNFISVKGDQALIQVSPVDSGGGPNGVGGVTVDGRIINVERRVDKRGNTTLSINVMGRAISASVTFTIPKGGNNTSVRISPTLNSNTITLYGEIVPRDQSNIFKGITL